ncbi:endonuclease/exonuclease/phosphatase family protein [Gramella sp. AN32]|uniref:Endonuclease/exonuclease/phosphatase family protein n=1 Tax=Christiangramia antarctica TaxID=2058158 RepID=A0ABW5X7C5_9FLAO|nr:endonuclease/exonuclease/phosphatase family protein [Gramella sp. AN32]MCM4154440.1 endonuclease [Gramella sp. AN32]
MKNLGIFDKLIFILNSLAATALLLSYLLPLVPPKSFPLLSVLSLGVPVLIVLNVLFIIYWLFRLKKQLILSLLILVIGYNYVSNFFEFSPDKEEGEKADFTVMSYNVRMFNVYNWSQDKNIPGNIYDFVSEKRPDVLCLQEYYVGESKISNLYPYQFIQLKDKNSEFGSAIFSKYPILKSYSFDFPHDGNNNAIYTDLLIKEDTVRVYNVHFQSLNIKPGIGDLQKEDSKKLLGRIGSGFSLQQEQAESMLKNLRESPYKNMIVGDFNNTSFSYIYNLLKFDGKYKDAFLQAGNGFGQTFKLNYFPLRIDFMLVEKSMEVMEYKKYKVDFSDHYPISTGIQL